MSKISRLFLLTFAASVPILQLSNNSRCQDIEVQLRLDPERSIVHVEGKRSEKGANGSVPLAFLSDYAGIELPKERIRNIKASGRAWSYDVDLTPMKAPGAMVHISWLKKDSGVLMLGDLLPRSDAKNGIVRLIMPTDWRRVTNPDVSSKGDGRFLMTDLDKRVFHVGSSLATIEGTALGLVVSEEWQFPTAEALDTASEVFREYNRTFRGSVAPPLIRLVKLPASVGADNWGADTRGSYITIVSTEMPFKSQSIQRLHEQLRHEMFHLWIPEGVNLTGHYDWFYEGFALYQSLKLGVSANRIRFDDYLDTLSRAYDIDRRLGANTSLIAASQNRWNGDNNTVVYARGMLVAFLCDLALMNASKGKLSTDDIVREVYRRHSGNAPAKDGNDAVISILKDHRELVPIVDDNVSGVKQIDWSTLIMAAGLQAGTVVSGVTTLNVVQKPSGSQKRLLDKLGYNNWRKLKSK